MPAQQTETDADADTILEELSDILGSIDELLAKARYQISDTWEYFDDLEQLTAAPTLPNRCTVCHSTTPSPITLTDRTLGETTTETFCGHHCLQQFSANYV